MKRTVKILLWSVCIYSFLFSGIVWTKPTTVEESYANDMMLIAQVTTTNTVASQNSLAQMLENNPSIGKLDPYQTIEPSLLFLFSMGIIGFVGVVRKKLY